MGIQLQMNKNPKHMGVEAKTMGNYGHGTARKTRYINRKKNMITNSCIKLFGIHKWIVYNHGYLSVE